jgi:hypothetical protein
VTKDCGFATSSAVTVTVNSLPSAGITAGGATTFCSGGSVLLSVPSGANKAYQWKKSGVNIPGATLSSYTATASENYKVSVTNTATGCSKTTAVPTYITVNPVPSSTITPQGPTTFCAGGSVTLKANSGAGLTYQWKKNGTNISGAANINYIATTAGVYRTKVTNANGCTKVSAGVTVNVPCKEGVPITIGIDVKVYPNPSSCDFVFEIENAAAEKTSISVYDMIGKEVLSGNIFNSQFTIRNPQLASGVYSAVIVNGENKKVLKLVKTK